MTARLKEVLGREARTMLKDADWKGWLEEMRGLQRQFLSLE